MPCFIPMMRSERNLLFAKAFSVQPRLMSSLFLHRHPALNAGPIPRAHQRDDHNDQRPNLNREAVEKQGLNVGSRQRLAGNLPQLRPLSRGRALARRCLMGCIDFVSHLATEAEIHQESKAFQLPLDSKPDTGATDTG